MLAQSAAAGATPAHARARYLTPTVTPSCTRPSSSTPSPVTALGYFAITKAIRASARLTSTARLVLLVLAGHLDNRSGEACPGMPRLAAECGLTVRTIERTIAALEVDGWITRDTAASRWGTNVYSITPRPDDVRPPRAPRGHPFADRVTPDVGSAPPPSRVQTTPDVGSGILPFWDLLHEPAVCPAPSWPSTHTAFDVDQEGQNDTAADPQDAGAGVGEVEPFQAVHEAQDGPGMGPQDAGAGVGEVEPFQAVHEAQDGPGVHVPAPPASVANRSAHILRKTAKDTAVANRSAQRAEPEPASEAAIVAELAARPELAALARPPVAALLAAECRTLSVVRRALDELVDAARLAAAAGEPWTVATLARKARAYVRRAYADPVTSTRPPSTPTPPEPPPEPPRFASSAPYLRGVLAALDTPTPAMLRRAR